MKAAKQAVAVLLGAGVVFFSPGLACYQALAGVTEVGGESGGGYGLEAGAEMPALAAPLIGPETLNLGGLDQTEALGNQTALPEQLPGALPAAAVLPEKAARAAVPAEAVAPEAEAGRGDASQALSKRMIDFKKTEGRAALRQKIKGVVSAAKALAQGVKNLVLARHQGLSAQDEAGRQMFDAAGKSEGTMPAAPGVIGSVGAFASLSRSANSARAGAESSSPVPEPKAAAYPAPISWLQKLERRLGLAGGVSQFTNFQARILPETSVLFTPFSHGGDPYYYDRAIAQRVLGQDYFYSYLALSGRNYIEVRNTSIQDAARMARLLQGMSEVRKVFVSRGALGLVRQSSSGAAAWSEGTMPAAPGVIGSLSGHLGAVASVSAETPKDLAQAFMRAPRTAIASGSLPADAARYYAAQQKQAAATPIHVQVSALELNLSGRRLYAVETAYPGAGEASWRLFEESGKAFADVHQDEDGSVSASLIPPAAKQGGFARVAVLTGLALAAAAVLIASPSVALAAAAHPALHAAASGSALSRGILWGLSIGGGIGAVAGALLALFAVSMSDRPVSKKETMSSVLTGVGYVGGAGAVIGLIIGLIVGAIV